MKKVLTLLCALVILICTVGCQYSKDNLVKTNFTSEEFAYAKEQAEFLTAHLIQYSFMDMGIDKFKKSVEPREVSYFILGAGGIYDTKTSDPNPGEIVIDPSKYTLYKDFIHRGELTLEFPVKSVNQMVYEVFGIKEWDLNGIELNEQKQQYETNLEFGFGYVFGCEDISSEVFEDTATVVTTFMLLIPNPISDTPFRVQGGYYTITYQIMRENERIFLRFLNMEAKQE